MAKKDAIEKMPEVGMIIPDYGADAGDGLEMTKDELVVPFIALLQALSPIVTEEKAKAGQFYNTVTEQIWEREQGFLFVPAVKRHYWAEWTPRDKGGGFHGHHSPESELVVQMIEKFGKFGKKILENGNELIQTYYLYGVVCTEDGAIDTPAAMAFASTKIREFRRWMSSLNFFSKGKIPLYANLTRIASKATENEKGKFYIPSLTPANGKLSNSLLLQEDERYQAAHHWKLLIESGDAKIDPGQQASQATSEEVEETPF